MSGGECAGDVERVHVLACLQRIQVVHPAPERGGDEVGRHEWWGGCRRRGACGVLGRAEGEKSHSTGICMYNMLVVSAQDHIVEVWGFGQG